MTTRTQTAHEAYAAKMMECQALAASILESVEDQPAPSARTTWSQVADATEILRRLREVADFLGIDD